MGASAATLERSGPTTRPAAGWRRIVSDAAWVSGSTLAGQALGAATSLLLRVLLSPTQIGLWQTVRLTVNYGNLSNLGVSRGATREMTIALGRGDDAAAERSANVALTVNTLASLVCGVGLIAGGALSAALWPASAMWAGALAVAGALCVIQRYITYQMTVLRARQSFALAARVTVLEAALTLAICGGASAWLGLPGLYAGSIVVGMLAAGYVAWQAPVGMRFAWDPPLMRRLLGIGFPILLAALATQVFRSLDRLTILFLFPDCATQLGIYSVALLVTGQLFGLANALATVMGPRYGEALGRHGKSQPVAALAALASGPHTAVVALCGSLGIVLGGPILAAILPAYRAGLPCLAPLVLGTIGLGAALPASQYLITVDRQRALLRIVVISIVVGVVANGVVVASGGGLLGLAVATALAQIVYAVAAVGCSFWSELSAGDRRRYLCLVFVPAAPSFLAACRLNDAGASWQAASTAAGAVAATWSATAWIAWHIDRKLRQCDATVPASLAQWQRRCYKPGALHLGNVFARRVTRPLALRITSLLAPLGVPAHAITLMALLAALASAATFAWGSATSALVGAILLQGWYLLDHVDGQLARYHQTASLDGVQLDYAMHHVVNLVVPLGLGWGLFRASGHGAWMLAGIVFATGLLGLGLVHDARYKAFVQRLKWVRGDLIVRGGGGYLPAAEPPMPRRAWALAGYLARQLCQMHVVMSLLSLLAVIGLFSDDQHLVLLRCYLGAMAILSLALAAYSLTRNIARGDAEAEFARWFHVPPGAHFQVGDDGWWRVESGPPQAPTPLASRARKAERPLNLLSGRKAG